MSAAADNKSFLDSVVARLIALIIAVLIGFFIWSKWSADIQLALSGGDKSVEIVSATEPAKPANPALEECLAKRIGDVNGMKEEGIISDAQYAAFKARAEDLCLAQNPSS